MLDWLRRHVQPGNAACIAAFLIAIGIETDVLYVHHTLEVVGAVIAFVGLFLRAKAPPQPVEYSASDRQRT